MNILGVATKAAAARVEATDIPRSVWPWAAWTLLAIFIVRSELRQWVTRTISSSLEALRHAATQGDPLPSSELAKIEQKWRWSFLVWKGV